VNGNGEKSHVGMMQCFYCGEPMGVMLDRHLHNTLPREAVYNYEPCDACKALMRQGVMLIEVRNGESGDNPHRTGRQWVIRDEAVKQIFQPPKQVADILRSRVAFIDQQSARAIGLHEAPAEAETAEG